MRTTWLVGMSVLLGACSGLLPSPTLNLPRDVACGIPAEACGAAVERAVDLIGNDDMESATHIAVGPGRGRADDQGFHAEVLICFGDARYVIVDVLGAPGMQPIASMRDPRFDEHALC